MPSMFKYRCYKPGDINATARIIESTNSLSARGIFARLYAGMHWAEVVAVRVFEDGDTPPDGWHADEIYPWTT